MTTETTNTKAPAISATIEGSVLSITSSDGHTIRLDAGSMTDDIRHAAMMHGFKQKLVDAAAISRNPDTGRSATTEDKMNAIREVAYRLSAGEWNKRREGDGTANRGLLLSALVRLYAGRKTEDQLREWLSGKDEQAQADLRADPKIAPIILAIKAERAAKNSAKVDTSAMLAELGD
jgi:hypothetical protein